MTIAQKIRRWRKARGLSQADLSRKLEVSAAAISQWESETTQPTHENLDALAKAFGITIGEFHDRPPPVTRRAA